MTSAQYSFDWLTLRHGSISVRGRYIPNKRIVTREQFDITHVWLNGKWNKLSDPGVRDLKMTQFQKLHQPVTSGQEYSLSVGRIGKTDQYNASGFITELHSL